MLDSTDLAEQTAHLSDAEFRAWVLIQAWANENGLDENGDLQIARSRLPSIAPNTRHSVATSARVVRELCTKIDFVFDSCSARAKKVLEGRTKWTLLMEKPEENQGSKGHTKKRRKKKEEKREEEKGNGCTHSDESSILRAVHAGWPRLLAAARSHGVEWAESPSEETVSRLTAHLTAGLSIEDLEGAVHGARSLWGEPREGWNPVGQMRPSVVFGSKLGEYVAAHRSKPAARESYEAKAEAHLAKVAANVAAEKAAGGTP